MNASAVAVLIASLGLALWRCALAFFGSGSRPRGRSFAISSASFLLLASLFAAASILSPSSGSVTWIFLAATSVHAVDVPRSQCLATTFLAAAALSQILHLDARDSKSQTQTQDASDILRLCGALIHVAGSLPGLSPEPETPPAPNHDQGPLTSISSRLHLSVKSD